ncbi:hypothetical protein [Cellulomonas denverensis]|uniref:hypothetical protein n=1 Tax=Cellulomonas denverensis TaxID=264297 RepID=UPI0035EDB60F
MHLADQRADPGGAIAEGWAWIGGLAELRDVRYVDLPTGHWPMWSRPAEVAALLGRIAEESARVA